MSIGKIYNSIDIISEVGTKEKLGARGGKAKKVRRQPELEEQAALIECADKTLSLAYGSGIT